MKTLVLVCVLSASAAAFAAPKGLSARQAEDLVAKAAHHFIANNAPDFGGTVHAPCDPDITGDTMTVTCNGIADETTAGDGSVKTPFACQATFVQGHDGLFYKNSRVSCSSTAD